MSWVESAARDGANLCVFPEYAGLEVSSIGGAALAADRAEALEFSATHIDKIAQIHQDGAKAHNVFVLSGSAPARLDGRYVNRAGLFCPNGDYAWQDKQIMTRFEREEWFVDGGNPLQVFDTPLGRMGVLICYDSEFPLLGQALRDVDILLVPSCTEAVAGYWRVRIGAMARALENQMPSSSLCQMTRVLWWAPGRRWHLLPADRDTGILTWRQASGGPSPNDQKSERENGAVQ